MRPTRKKALRCPQDTPPSKCDKSFSEQGLFLYDFDRGVESRTNGRGAKQHDGKWLAKPRRGGLLVRLAQSVASPTGPTLFCTNRNPRNRARGVAAPSAL